MAPRSAGGASMPEPDPGNPAAPASAKPPRFTPDSAVRKPVGWRRGVGLSDRWLRRLGASLRWKWLVAGMTLITLAAALRSSSPGWFALVLSGSAALLAWAVLAAILARRWRPFWFSLSVVTGLHLALSFGPWANERVAPRLFSVQAVNALAQWLEPRWRLQREPPDGLGALAPSIGKYPGGDGTGALPDVRYLRQFETGQASFFRICHILSAFLLGAVVGLGMQHARFRHV